MQTHLVSFVFTGGHYVAYAKNEETNNWLEFNDSLVAPGKQVSC